MRRHVLRRMRNFCLRAWTLLNFVAWMAAICAIDSDSMVPFIVLCATSAWLALYGWANDWQTDSYEERRRRQW